MDVMSAGTRWWIVPLFAALMLCAGAARADYEKGRVAWDAGRHVEAVGVWRAAAQANDARAMLALGRAFAKGLGAPQDFVEAHKWFNLAAGRGSAEAVAERDALAVEMTAAERAEARALARAWRSGGARTIADPPSAAAPETAVAPTTPGPPPERAIKEAQTLLAALGYKPGTPDGKWGKRSVQAYRDFLRDAGMQPEDMLTPSALRAMRAAARGRNVAASAASSRQAPAAQQKAALPHADLHRAAKTGDLDGLEAALKSKTDVNARDARGWTPLMHAVNKGHTLMVPPLLKAGADVNLRAPDGATALFIAALHGHSQIVEQLMRAGADASIKGPKDRTAEDVLAARTAKEKYNGTGGLHKALRANESPTVVKTLLDWGADISNREPIPETPDFTYFYTPLHTAARYNTHTGVIALLLKHGANIKERVEHRYKQQERESGDTTAIALAAASNENPEIALLLLEHGGGHHGQEGVTLLHWAAANSNPELSELLLDRGADVNAKNDHGVTPLHWAASSGHVETAKLLLDRGADVNAAAINDIGTPLHFAVSSTEPTVGAMIRLLIARGADVEASSYFGTPLTNAVYKGNRTAVLAFPPYERGSIAVIDGSILRLEGEQLKKLKESKGAGADPGWFDRRPDCVEADDGASFCSEPVCRAAGLDQRLTYSNRSAMIMLLLERGTTDFLDQRNHEKSNYQLGSRCMLRTIHRTAKKRNKEAIERWMRLHSVDFEILTWKRSRGRRSGSPKEPPHDR